MRCLILIVDTTVVKGLLAIYNFVMSSLWNLLAPTRSGMVKIAGSGNELFGTVVRHGLTDKTIAVRVSSQHYNKKYKLFLNTHINKLVHDEMNYCVSGDKVIIKGCPQMSKQKHYYVKNILAPFSRDEFNWEGAPLKETEAKQSTAKDHPLRKTAKKKW